MTPGLLAAGLLLAAPKTVTLIGYLAEQGQPQCNETYERTWVDLHDEIGWVRVAKSAVPLKPLRNHPVVAEGVPLEKFERPPVPAGGMCPPMQMRSDWVEGKNGIRIVRGGGADFPAIEVTRVQKLDRLQARADGDDVVVQFSNPLDRPLANVVVALHYEGCYGKPGSTVREEGAAALGPERGLTAKWPSVLSEDGRNYAAQEITVRGTGKDVVFDLQVPLRHFGIKAECPDERADEKERMP